MNIFSRVAHWCLLSAASVVVASGCAGMGNSEAVGPWLSRTEPVPSRPSVTSSAPVTRTTAGNTAVGDPAAGDPAANSPVVTGPAGAHAAAGHPGDSRPAATIRGQGGWDTDAGAPGSDEYTRQPMQASGAAEDDRAEDEGDSMVRQTAYQPPAAPGTAPGYLPQPPPDTPAGLPNGGATPVTAPADANSQWLTSPYLNQGAQGYMPSAEQLPGTPVPVDIMVEEARTGRFMFGAGINSDAGVTGQVTIDERNFNLFGFPTSFSELWSGEAFRGAGQGFRLEAMPGNRVQRYLVSFTEPYLFSTPVSLNVSGFLFDRGYYDWSESRLGGRLGLGYRLTPDLSFSGALRLEEVEIRDPRILGVAALDKVVGNNDFYSSRFTLRHDTRDLPFAPTEGHLIELSYEQAFGEFDYPRGEFDFRKYYLVRERPDGSGRHTIAVSLGAGFSGSDTPLFENYFAGGFSTIRGFEFRGASPVDKSVVVGGQFRMLGSVEYTMPLTADDMIKAVAFCDYGTVEQEITIDADNFRVAPGFGFRISVPALGPAPLAFDFAFPIAHADTDETQVFSFFFGIGRG